MFEILLLVIKNKFFSSYQLLSVHHQIFPLRLKSVYKVILYVMLRVFYVGNDLVLLVPGY